MADIAVQLTDKRTVGKGKAPRRLKTCQQDKRGEEGGPATAKSTSKEQGGGRGRPRDGEKHVSRTGVAGKRGGPVTAWRISVENLGGAKGAAPRRRKARELKRGVGGSRYWQAAVAGNGRVGPRSPFFPAALICAGRGV